MTSETTQQSCQPLVSVIVPTYNYGHFISQTLESVRAQTYARWECVVVDDGSTDDTPAVVARFAGHDARVKYLRQENRRQAAAKNTGLRHSAGEYVQFLDADDLIEPRKLERQVAYLEGHPEVDIVYGGVRYFKTESPGERLHSADEDNLPWMTEASGRGREIVAALLRKNMMTINAPLVRRGVVEAVGFFDETLPHSQAEDWDYWLRCALAGKRFQYAGDEGTLALVRAHPASSSRNRARMYRAMLLMRAKFAATTNDAELLALNREMAAADEGYLGVEEAVAGNLLKGMRGIFRAAVRERRTRWRAKWLFCALAAPFVPKTRLRGMIGMSLTEAASNLRRKSGSEPT